MEADLKFHVPDTYEYFREKGFATELDLFGREKVARSLTSIVSCSEDPLVICLNAAWGEGKTSFLHMWMHQLEEKSVPVIYFDAFKHDHHQDPFIPISSAIYEYASKTNLSSDEVVKSFSASVGRVMKVGAKSGLKFFGRALAYKCLGDSDISKIAEDVIDGAVSEAEKIGDAVLNIYKEQEKSLDSVKITLQSLAYDLLKSSNNKNLVFIVDELDRCKPDFALALIEVVKHIFAAKNVIFLLSVNKVQLAHSLQGIYGSSFDANNYLDKFINISTALPKLGKTPEALDTIEEYIKQTSTKIGVAFYDHHIATLAIYCRSLRLPLRLINKSIVNLGIYYETKDDHMLLNSEVSNITIGMCVFKAAYPRIFEIFSSSYISGQSISESSFRELLESSVLHGQIGDDWKVFLLDVDIRDISKEVKRKQEWRRISRKWESLPRMLHDVAQPLMYFSIL